MAPAEHIKAAAYALPDFSAVSYNYNSSDPSISEIMVNIQTSAILFTSAVHALPYEYKQPLVHISYFAHWTPENHILCPVDGGPFGVFDVDDIKRGIKESARKIRATDRYTVKSIVDTVSITLTLELENADRPDGKVTIVEAETKV